MTVFPCESVYLWLLWKAQGQPAPSQRRSPQAEPRLGGARNHAEPKRWAFL